MAPDVQPPTSTDHPDLKRYTIRSRANFLCSSITPRLPAFKLAIHHHHSKRSIEYSSNVDLPFQPLGAKALLGNCNYVPTPYLPLPIHHSKQSIEDSSNWRTRLDRRHTMFT